MRSISLAAVTGFMIVECMAILLLQVQGVRSMAQSSENQALRVPLVAYLAELGRDHDRFFTIEEAWENGKPTDSIDAHWIQRSSEVGLQRELERLGRTVPNFTFEVDKVNPRIVHIRDKRLAQQQGYGLEALIKIIDFTGRVNDLPNELHKQGIPISPPPLMDTRDSRDYTTIAQVKGESLKVRNALSNFIPLEGRRGRILWIARTKLGQQEVTYVYYP